VIGWSTAARLRRAAGLVALSALSLVVPAPAGAQTLSVSGSPGTLVVQAAVAGMAPTSVMDNSTTYTVPANCAGNSDDKGANNCKTSGSLKITARLSSTMPAGVTLAVTVNAPSGATSLGPVVLDATTRDVVTGISGSTGSTLQSITYSLSATAAAGVVPAQTRTVTLTVTSAP
jgi:hypothetical protein